MVFNIASFDAAMTKKGLLKPNKFLVHITPPVHMLSNFLINDHFSTPSMRTETMNGIQQMNDLQFWAEGASIPGILAMNQDVNRYSYGTTEKKPFRAVFNDISLVIIADARMDNWRFFSKWFSLVINHDMSDGDILSNKQPFPATNPPQSAYELSYKEDYQSTVVIHVFDDAGNESINITLRNAWPIFMGDIQLNWGENGHFMRIPVSITFNDWYINGSAPLTQQSRNAPHAEGKPKPVDGNSFPAPTDF
jgi:hypothetical protein